MTTLLAGGAGWLALRAWATLRATAFPYLGMLVAMLLRLDEYTGHAHHGHEVVAA
jgi:hypothetical protein